MLDVGANVGFHALCGQSVFDRVHAFEPVPTTAARLRRNVELSDASETILVHEVALSVRSGRAGMSVESGHCGANRLVGPGDRAAMQVPTTTLDELVERDGIKGVDFVKIDVEGHEAEVIRGARDLVRRDRPRLLVELGGRDRFERFLAVLPSDYRISAPTVNGEGRPVSRWRDAAGFRDLLFTPRER